jgi:hypothetical protein
MQNLHDAHNYCIAALISMMKYIIATLGIL